MTHPTVEMVGTELCLRKPHPALQFCQPLLERQYGIKLWRRVQHYPLSHLKILSLPLVAGEEVLTSLQGWDGSEGEHLPERDPEGPDITLVTVLPVGETLDGLPPHGDVGVGVHLVEVIGGHSRQAKVRYFDYFHGID